MVTNGCVFFISIGAVLGVAGITAIRAVSFLGLAAGEAGAAATGGGGGATGDGLGTEGWGGMMPEPPLGGGTAGGRAKGGGSLRLAGAGGSGACVSGGGGGGAGGTAGGGRTCGLSGGGRAGKLMRVVSRPGVPAPGDSPVGDGCRLMRTVSFLGSFGSAIRLAKLAKQAARNFSVCHSLSWLWDNNPRLHEPGTDGAAQLPDPRCYASKS
jgi:hypothetical protein